MKKINLIEDAYIISYHDMAEECWGADDNQGVIKYCSMILALDPDCYSALCNRAGAYCMTRRFSLALTDAEKAIKINPDRSSAKRWREAALESRTYYRLAE
jgi:tetratricopeptide (TPR) repeat protein